MEKEMETRGVLPAQSSSGTRGAWQVNG
jgi:hypothetical protein